MATLKKGTIVQRLPYTGIKAGTKGTIVGHCYRSCGANFYDVRLEGGRMSIWSDEYFMALPESCTQEAPPAPSERGAGLKDDSGKQQPRLLHEGVPLALAEVVRTLTFGAKKYAPHSWKEVENALERYQDASYRHDAKRCAGELIDPETNIRHRAHHIINELFMLELELRKEKAE